MKKQVKITFAFTLLLSILISCKKDFLVVVPKGSQVAKTVNDYDQLMNSAEFYEYNYAGGWQAPILMGDEVAAEDTYFNSSNRNMQRLFRWDDVIYDPGDIARDLTFQLSNMYTCNKIINEVMAATKGTEQEKLTIQAEALATRAWLNFQFINVYAKPYKATTASTDLGFPIITAGDVTQTSFSRGTVQEMYDFIIKDLTTAIPVLPVQSRIATRFSKAAAQGLLGKVYLFMGKNQEALEQFNLAFANIAAMSAPPKLYDYNVTFAPGGKFLPISTFSGPASPGNKYKDLTESVLAKTFYGGVFTGNVLGNDFLVISPEALAKIYGPTDWRLKFYSAVYPNGIKNPTGRLRKYGVTYVKFGLQLQDLYLLSAECKARLNQLPEAKADLLTLRNNRMPATDAGIPDAIAENQIDLLRFIFEERTREFAFEGYRWFDMRRLSVDPLFSGATYTHTLYQASGTPIVYTLKPERLTLRLPQEYIDSNPGMPNNP